MPFSHSSEVVVLLYRTANLGKHIVSVRPNEADRTHDNDENHSQHYRVFRDILTLFVIPELL